MKRLASAHYKLWWIPEPMLHLYQPPYIAQLNIQVDNRKYLRSQWGERRVVDTYFLDVGIDGLRLPAIEIVADPLTEEVIVGRNILNKLVITLNGPAQALEIVA